MKILKFLCENRIRVAVFVILCATAALSVWNFNSKFSRSSEFVGRTHSGTEIVAKIVSYPVSDGSNLEMTGRIVKCVPKELVGTSTHLILRNSGDKTVNRGDTVRLKGTLTLPDEASVPGAFDYRSYLRSLNVVSVCRAEYDDVTVIGGSDDPAGFVYEARKTFMDNVGKMFEGDYVGLVKAVITGDRSGIGEELSENLKVAGVYHIVAISGLHLNIFVCYIAFLLSRLKVKRFRKIMITYGVCTICAVFVLIFTGSGVSVIRAFSMLVILFVSEIFSRDYSSKNALAVSALFVLIFMPHNIGNVAFYLSFLSTLGVLVSVDITDRLKERGRLGNNLFSHFIQVVVTSFMTTLLTLPVTVTSFGYIPVFSWLANLIILPVMAPFLGSVLLCTVAGSLGMQYIASCAAGAARTFAFVITEVSRLINFIPFAALEVNPADVVVLTAIVLTVGAIIYVAEKYGIFKSICVLLVFSLAFTGVLKYNSIDGIIKVHFVDIGQGDCSLVEIPDGRVVLIDCGNQSGEDYAGKSIASFLKSRNIKKIDAAFVSHYHTDHVSGIIELVKNDAIKTLFLPVYFNSNEAESERNKEALMAEAVLSDTDIRMVAGGSSVSVGEACFEVVSAGENMSYNANGMSAVIEFTYGSNSFLFTGDIEGKSIDWLLNNDVRCDVLKVPHHGSKTGAVEELYLATNPQYAVISCGKNNNFGHPSTETLDIIGRRGIECYRTDTDGVITFTANKEKILNISTTG